MGLDCCLCPMESKDKTRPGSEGRGPGPPKPVGYGDAMAVSGFQDAGGAGSEKSGNQRVGVVTHAIPDPRKKPGRGAGKPPVRCPRGYRFVSREVLEIVYRPVGISRLMGILQWGINMQDIFRALEAARNEMELLMAAASAFRAALRHKEDGPVSGTPGLSQGVLRARRRELESSCEYLARLDADAAAAREAVARSERAWAAALAPCGTRESGVA
ncbi:MAG: hypothetical protein JWO30_876 [Fibrobacteres bacterium]|nr:hypothetical protein [Fibrobacterota bacterium]